MSDLSQTIIAKSDQLNSDDLIGRHLTIRITNVTAVAGDQPIAVHFEGDEGKPWKPCKTMRRLLVFAWGPDGKQYAGRKLTLFRDETVKFGGAEVGGIRVSHMSHIGEAALTVGLAVSKGKKKPITVHPIIETQRLSKPPAKTTASQSAVPTATRPQAEVDAEYDSLKGDILRVSSVAELEKVRERANAIQAQLTADQKSFIRSEIKQAEDDLAAKTKS